MGTDVGHRLQLYQTAIRKLSFGSSKSPGKLAEIIVEAVIFFDDENEVLNHACASRWG